MSRMTFPFMEWPVEQGKEEPMLVLSRKERQKIRLGRNVTITIVRIRGNRVSVGIDAPEDVHIVRGELSQQDDELSREETDPLPAA